MTPLSRAPGTPRCRYLGYECVDEEKRGGVRRWRISVNPEVLSTSLGSPASLAEPESQPSPTSSLDTPDRSTGLAGHAVRGQTGGAGQKKSMAPVLQQSTRKCARKALLRTMEASPVRVALMVLLGKSGARTEKFHGTMAELKILLEPLRSEDRRDWPHSPKGMGDALRRLAPALRVLGFDCVPGIWARPSRGREATT
jgi:hypothetical protein